MIGCGLSVVGIWLIGTVFQTALLYLFFTPETSSRVTLASLGIGFQPNLPTTDNR